MRNVLRLAALTIALSTAAQAGTVTMWTSHGPDDVKVFNQIARNFEKANPGVTVKIVQVPGDQTDSSKLMSAVAGGTGPDVYLLDRFVIAERASTGLLEPLDKYMDTKKLKNLYLPFAWAETQFKGQTYGLPNETDARALIYRKDMLKAAGINLAELDPKNGPITPKRFMEIALKLNKTDSKGNYTQMGVIPWNGEGHHYTWGWAFGGDFGNPSKCSVTPTNAGVVAGFQYLKDFAKAMGPQKIKLWNDTFYGSGYSASQDPFYTRPGRMAMIVTGDYALAGLRKYAPDMEIGITYLPSYNKKPVTWAGGWSVVMPKGAKNPTEAAKFMQYFAGEPGQRLYTSAMLRLPTIKSLLNDPNLYGKNAPYAKERAFFRSLLNNAKSRPALPVGALYWDEMSRARDKVIYEQADPKALLQTVQNTVQGRLNRFCK